MSNHQINSISPLDGRYGNSLGELSSYFSEKATDRPVEIKDDVFGFIFTGSLMKAIRSIPEAVSYTHLRAHET